MEQILRSPVEVGRLSRHLLGVYTSQVVQEFWTINGMFQKFWMIRWSADMQKHELYLIVECIHTNGMVYDATCDLILDLSQEVGTEPESTIHLYIYIYNIYYIYGVHHKHLVTSENQP